jgi:hypothetical protein
MAGSTSVTLNDLLPSIVAEAMFVAQERSIMRGLVKNYTVAPGQGKTVTVPIYPVQTAVALTEGDDFGNTAVSTDQGLLTVSQVGIMTMVTDLAVNASSSNVITDLGQLFGNAIESVICLDTGADKDEALSPYKDSGLWWIEDKPANADVGHNLGLKSILIEHGHNMHHECSYPVVKNWKEIYELITSE